MAGRWRFGGWFTRISDHFRRRRMGRFLAEFSITAQTRILDVGGAPGIWRLLPEPPRVTLLNMPRTQDELAGAEEWVAGDGRALPFADGAFDIVFSNSVIEHVGDSASQERFAREVARVGRSYWVQTPNRWFPVEQHLLTPFIHWLPKPWQRALVPRFTVWGAITRIPADGRAFYFEHYLNEVRLLRLQDLRRLFPEARLLRERFLGFTKSWMAVKGGAPRRRAS